MEKDSEHEQTNPFPAFMFVEVKEKQRLVSSPGFVRNQKPTFLSSFLMCVFGCLKGLAAAAAVVVGPVGPDLSVQHPCCFQGTDGMSSLRLASAISGADVDNLD